MIGIDRNHLGLIIQLVFTFTLITAANGYCQENYTVTLEFQRDGKAVDLEQEKYTIREENSGKHFNIDKTKATLEVFAKSLRMDINRVVDITRKSTEDVNIVFSIDVELFSKETLLKIPLSTTKVQVKVKTTKGEMIKDGWIHLKLVKANIEAREIKNIQFWIRKPNKSDFVAFDNLIPGEYVATFFPAEFTEQNFYRIDGKLAVPVSFPAFTVTLNSAQPVMEGDIVMELYDKILRISVKRDDGTPLGGSKIWFELSKAYKLGNEEVLHWASIKGETNQDGVCEFNIHSGEAFVNIEPPGYLTAASKCGKCVKFPKNENIIEQSCVIPSKTVHLVVRIKDFKDLPKQIKNQKLKWVVGIGGSEERDRFLTSVTREVDFNTGEVDICGVIPGKYYISLAPIPENLNKEVE